MADQQVNHHGWLSKRTDIVRDPSWFNGVALQPDISTRWEEFDFILSQIQDEALILDAGTGFNPVQHLLPYILVINTGAKVVALDKNKATMQMPAHEKVNRLLGDIAALPFADASLDAYCCVSVLEHVDDAVIIKGINEAWRTLKPGGKIILTFDCLHPHSFVVAYMDAFDCGEYEEFVDKDLCPKVGFVVGTRLGD